MNKCGNKNQITVSGESAGGWSVGNLMQNSEVTKIVKKAISHSGVVLFDMMNQHTENINDFLRTISISAPKYWVIRICITYAALAYPNFHVLKA